MATTSEKGQMDTVVSHDEAFPSSDVVLDEKAYKRIRHKIHLRLLPALGLIHGISLMDRKNTSNAAIAGMLVDLKMTTGMGYNLINLVFFISMVVAQFFGAILCQKIGARRFLTGVCVMWGVVTLGFGFVKNWESMIPLRMLLGLFEAGFTPGSIYLLSTWYTRFDVGRTFSVFYLTGIALAALSGPLAYALSLMEGSAGVRGWRWIFIMEGIITVTIGFLGFLVLVNFPDKEVKKRSFKFLTDDEMRHTMDRLEKDRDDVAVEPFSIRKFISAGKDFTIWYYAFLYFLSTTVTYSFTFFLPIIFSITLKFNTAMSQTLSAPPYLLSTLCMYIQARLADRYKMRAIFIQINSVVCIVGMAIMGFHKDPWIRYFGSFLAVVGAVSNAPVLMAWQANNVRGQFPRSFSSTTLTVGGAMAGISGSLIFRSQDKPKYVPGLSTCLGCAIAVNILSTILALYFRRCNKRADEGKLVINGLPDFRYTI